MTHDYVYLATDGFCQKVGISRNVARRRATLRPFMPGERVEIVKSWYRPGSARKIEQMVCDMLFDYRIRGREWFNLKKPETLEMVERVVAAFDNEASRSKSRRPRCTGTSR